MGVINIGSKMDELLQEKENCTWICQNIEQEDLTKDKEKNKRFRDIDTYINDRSRQCRQSSMFMNSVKSNEE